MPLPARSLAIVGADYPNKRGPARRFEIAMCKPGDPVQIVPEPNNPVDPNAVMVVTERGICIGYIRAEYASWYRNQIASGRIIDAVFQQQTDYGAVIRIAFDGETPTLPPPRPPAAPTRDGVDADPGFYPDEEWPE